MGAQISLIVRPNRNKTLPVVLRVYQDLIVLRRVEIQNRLENFILDLNELQRLVHALLIPSCHDGDHIAHIPDMAVHDQAVIWAHLRVGLARLGVTSSVLRNIFPSVDCLDAVHLHRRNFVDRSHDCIRVGGAEKLHDQAVLRRDVIHVDRLSCHKLHGVLFPHRFVYIFHASAASFPLFSFFHSRNAWMPRSCPS